MRRRTGRWFIIPVFLLLVILAAFIFFWARGGAAAGPPVALCPGPDQYGYTCLTNGAIEYIDAGNDAGLYADDDLVQIALPFSFTFYGAVYDQVWLSSNGTLQFGSGLPAYENQCFDESPVANMGEMIAPYWDDLNLTQSGALETAVVGAAPDRIFVVEWDDVPSYQNPLDTVTFEVQLFEGSNDILFLYQDVSRQEGDRGSSATIGLQSEAHGFALQYGCDQFVLRNGLAIQFLHPAEPGQGTGFIPGAPRRLDGRGPALKDDLARLTAALDRSGLTVLPELRYEWLPAKDSQWTLIDAGGSKAAWLVFLWRGPAQARERTRLVVMSPGDDGRWRPRFEAWPLARQDVFNQLFLSETVDLTGDGLADVLFQDEAADRLLLLSRTTGEWALHPVPFACTGSLIVRDETGDGQVDIIRSGCESRGRTIQTWTGSAFSVP